MELILKTAKVRRRVSETTEIRQSLIRFFTDNYPPLRSLKIKDHKRHFIAHAKAGKRYLYAKAYNLSRLKEYFIREIEEKVLTMV